MKGVLFIPVWNQVEEFPIVLKELKEASLPCKVLLVNNGSTDGSEKLVRESGYPYIDLPKNLGVGGAFIRAIEWALEHNFEVLASMAANAKMLPSEFHRIWQPIVNQEADYVTGSRFLEGGAYPNLPLFRRASIPLVNVFVWILTGARLSDATCGYRAFKLEIIKKANFNWKAKWLYTYGFEYYLYAKVILSRQWRWKEVPITMRYPEKGRRYSKIRPFKGWYEMLKPWIVAKVDGKGFC